MYNGGARTSALVFSRPTIHGRDRLHRAAPGGGGRGASSRQIAVRADPASAVPTLAGSMTATFSNVQPL